MSAPRYPGHRRTGHGEAGLFERQAGIAEGRQRAVLVDTSADLKMPSPKSSPAKSFDYGTVFFERAGASGRTPLRDRILGVAQGEEGVHRHRRQKEALGKLLVMPHFSINPHVRGQAPTKLGAHGGFRVPPDTSIIWRRSEGVGKQHPLSMEKLSPVLALIWLPILPAALDTCYALLKFRRTRPHGGDLLAQRRRAPASTVRGCRPCGCW